MKLINILLIIASVACWTILLWHALAPMRLGWLIPEQCIATCLLACALTGAAIASFCAIQELKNDKSFTNN